MEINPSEVSKSNGSNGSNESDKYNISGIQLEKPKKLDDLYVSNINFTLQTPKLKIDKISKKITLVLNDETEEILNKFDNKIIELISENSNEFFEDTLTIEDTEEIYKSSYKESKNNSKMSISINKKLNIYNKHKEQLELDTLSSGDTVICLLKCKKIVFYKTHCEPYWEVFQIKLKEEKINSNGYLFLEDPNDTNSNDDKDDADDDEINQIKKIKIKS